MLIVKFEPAFSAPVVIPGLPDVAVISTPEATLRMIAVVSVPALYPAAVANDKIFTSAVFDVISSVMSLIACPPWTAGINIS
jgi:hypothetical protein